MKKPDITKGVWKWVYHDKSAMSLMGDGLEENHVLCQEPCKSCQENIKEGDPFWGECTVVSLADGKAISAVPEMIDALLKAREEIHGLLHEFETHTRSHEDIVKQNETCMAIDEALIKAGCTEVVEE